MRHLSPKNSLLFFLDELEFSEAALAAEPGTEALAHLFREAIEEWEDIFAIERKARRGVVRARAVLNVNDAKLDQLTRKLGGLVYIESGQDRKSTFFRRFFPKAPSALIRWSFRKQCDQTLNVMVPEIEKMPEDSPLRPFAASMRDAATATIGALDSRSKRQGERSMSAIEVDEWKEGINRLRFSVYAELMSMASENRYSRAWPETFFRAGKSAAPAKENDDATGEADNPTND